MKQPDLVIGVGSPHGDDAVGWRIVERLAAAALPAIETTVVRTPSEIASLAAGRRRLWIVDGSRSDPPRPAGTIARFVWQGDGRLPGSGTSSHGLGIAEALQLLTALGMPPAVIVYAIEVARTDPETELTPAVGEAVPRVVEQLLHELVEIQCTSSR